MGNAGSRTEAKEDSGSPYPGGSAGDSIGRVAERGKSALKVLLVDDHPMMRRVVQMACASDDGIEIVGEAGDGEEALAKAEELKPDVVVLDIILPKLDGFEVARRLKAGGNGPHILMLTSREDNEAAFEAISAGVDGLLDKSRSAEGIAESIRAVGEGQKLITRDQEDMAINRLKLIVDRARETSAVTGKLTVREMEVLELIGEGLTTYQMGGRMGLSARTVESHISHIYRKLQVKTRTEAMSKARKLGIIENGSGQSRTPRQDPD